MDIYECLSLYGKYYICKIKITTLLEVLNWEEFQQAGEKGWQESHEGQQGEMQSPAHGDDQYLLEATQMESSSTDKELGVLVDTKLTKS